MPLVVVLDECHHTRSKKGPRTRRRHSRRLVFGRCGHNGHRPNPFAAYAKSSVSSGAVSCMGWAFSLTDRWVCWLRKKLRFPRITKCGASVT